MPSLLCEHELYWSVLPFSLCRWASQVNWLSIAMSAAREAGAIRGFCALEDRKCDFQGQRDPEPPQPRSRLPVLASLCTQSRAACWNIGPSRAIDRVPCCCTFPVRSLARGCVFLVSLVGTVCLASLGAWCSGAGI